MVEKYKRVYPKLRLRLFLQAKFIDRNNRPEAIAP
jgi:hypothetical protein